MVFYTRARLGSAFEVQCELPFDILDLSIQWSSIRWLISVSNDNITFSDEQALFVFDSKCLICDDNDTCIQKVFYIVLLKVM